MRNCSACPSTDTSSRNGVVRLYGPTTTGMIAAGMAAGDRLHGGRRLAHRRLLQPVAGGEADALAGHAA